MSNVFKLVIDRARKTSVFYGWYIIGAGVILAIYNSGAIVYGFTAFIDPIVGTYGWSYAQVSLALSLRGLEMGVFSPLLGVLVDRWPFRRLMLIGVVLTGVGLLLLGRSDSLVTFYIAFMVVGLGSSLATMMVPTAAAVRWFKKDVGKANGILAMGIGIGGALIPFLVMMIDAFGWQNCLLILAAGMVVLGIPLSLVFRNRPEDYGLLPDGKSGEITRNPRKPETLETSLGPRETLKTRAFWHIGLAFLAQVAGMQAAQTLVMPYLVSLGISRATAGLVAMLIPLISLAARLPFGWLADIFHTKYVLAVSIALNGIGLFFFWGLNNHSTWLMVLFLITFGLGSAGMTPLRAPVLKEYFGSRRFGTIYGLTSIFTTVGLVAGPYAAGWVFDTFGTYKPVWLVLSIINILGTVSIITTPRTGQLSPATQAQAA